MVPSAARRYGSFGSLTSGSRRQLYKSRAQSFQELMLILAHEDLNGRYEGQSQEKLLSAGEKITRRTDRGPGKVA